MARPTSPRFRPSVERDGAAPRRTDGKAPQTGASAADEGVGARLLAEPQTGPDDRVTVGEACTPTGETYLWLHSVAHPSSQRTYVLDTSVLLSDPMALLRFDEHEVVLPVVVITELEGKRSHPELGYFARQALRLLDDLRIKHGRLDDPLPVNDAAARSGWSSTTPTPRCSLWGSG